MSNTDNLIKESHFIAINATDKLHIKRIYQQNPSEPILMLHGAIANGKIFYSNSNKGLAPFLAKQGYDVFVLDLRGRGLSTPIIDRHSQFSQTEAITEDIPAAIHFIQTLRGNIKQHWIAHSWGGVLFSSYLARNPEYCNRIKSMTYIATKRYIGVYNWRRLLYIDAFWCSTARLICKIVGYLPAKEMRFGLDNESKLSHLHSAIWVASKAWRDPKDGFDYGDAIKKIVLPPTLYLAGANDYYLGNPKDVQRFIKECGDQKTKFILLSKENGFKHDYAHSNILTHPDAKKEQFLLILDWLQEH